MANRKIEQWTVSGPGLNLLFPPLCPFYLRLQTASVLSRRLRLVTESKTYRKVRTDRAVQEIRTEVRESNCIGVPPHDHPHVYINMGDRNTILCPYCVTRYRYDPRFPPFEADSRDSLFVDLEAV